MIICVALLVFVVLCVVLQQLVRRMEDNTKVRGDRYVNFTATTWLHAGPLVQRAWLNETAWPEEQEWPRYGQGWLVRVLPTVAVHVGRWQPWDYEAQQAHWEERSGYVALPPIKEWKRSLKKVA